MHKQLLNRVSIALKLRPRGGFLIKSGNKGQTMLHPELPDLQAMRTRLDGEETVFIPGSSLKGVFRSGFERQLRSLNKDWACDPLNQTNNCCHSGPNLDKPSSQQIHASLCLACRTFGSQQIGGRVRFADALPLTEKARKQANRVEQRAGVSIDRKTGGPARGRLFNMEVVTGGVFETTLQAENVQLWQLGLLASLLDDLRAGELRIGSATTRGLGAFRLDIPEIRFWQRHGTVPTGVGTLSSEDDYGWRSDGSLPDGIAQSAEVKRRRGGRQWIWSGDQVNAVLEAMEEAGWSHLEST